MGGVSLWARHSVPGYRGMALWVQEHVSREQLTRSSAVPVQKVEITYIHIPKTGGTSVLAWLAANSNLSIVRSVRELQHIGATQDEIEALCVGHMNLDSCIKSGLITGIALDNSKSFTIVRHPVARAKSLFRFMQQAGTVPLRWDFIKFLEAVKSSRRPPGAYNAWGLSPAWPQTYWIRQSEWTGPKQCLQLEQLAHELPLLNRFLFGQESSPSGKGLPHLNRSARDIENPEESSTTLLERELIHQIYQDDFDYLNYH